MSSRFSFINNEFLEESKACLHVSDLATQRGYGVFDYCRAKENTPVHLEDHIDRFFRSADIMHLKVPISKTSLIEIVYELIRKNNIPQSGIRMILTGGYSPDSYEIVEPNLVVLQNPLLLRNPGSWEKGIKIITHEYVREFPQAKTINYSMGIWLQPKIKELGAADVLYHQQGEVSEFPRGNFFIVTRDNVVITPKKNVLCGITREKILALSSKGFSIQEGVVTISDIRNANEAFMTSTTKRLLPVIQVDNFMVGNGRCGDVTNEIDRLLAKEENLIIQ